MQATASKKTAAPAEASKDKSILLVHDEISGLGKGFLVIGTTVGMFVVAGMIAAMMTKNTDIIKGAKIAGAIGGGLLASKMLFDIKVGDVKEFKV